MPESDKTVCRETELVRGHGAQLRVGARKFCSFAFSCLRTLPHLARFLKDFCSQRRICSETQPATTVSSCAEGLVASVFVLLSTVRYALIRFSITPTAARALPFACCGHCSCVTLFSQVCLVHLIFAVPVPQIQKQIVGCPWSLPRSMRR